MNKSPRDIDHLSNSSLKTYLNCPKQWAHKYLEGMRGTVGVALIKGSAVDHAADVNWQQKRKSGDDLSIDDAQELAEGMFRQKVDEAGGRTEVDWHGNSFPEALQSALKLTARHMRDHAPLYTPTATQVRVSRKLDSGRDFIGFIDAVTEDGVVIDVKSGNRKLPQRDADTDLQPGAYAFGLGRPVDFVYLRVIDSGRAPVHSEMVTTRRSQAGVEWFETLANDVDRAIDAGVFPANPGWSCSWCPALNGCVATVTVD